MAQAISADIGDAFRLDRDRFVKSLCRRDVITGDVDLGVWSRAAI